MLDLSKLEFRETLIGDLAPGHPRQEDREPDDLLIQTRYLVRGDHIITSLALRHSQDRNTVRRHVKQRMAEQIWREFYGDVQTPARELAMSALHYCEGINIRAIEPQVNALLEVLRFKVPENLK